MRHLIFSLLLLCAVSASALTATEAFTSAPASVFPLLDKNTRLDMVDYFVSGLSTPSANLMQGSSVITAIDPASVKVRMTDSSTAQVMVLPLGNDTIIALISTVAAPGLDSTITFYDSSWNQIATAKYFAKPGWKDWTTPGTNVEEVTMQAPFMLASYEYDPSTMKLTLTNNLSKFLDPDVYEMISTSLNPTLIYEWSGKKFTKK